MSVAWIPMAERIVFATLNRGSRSIAVTSPQTGTGVSLLCETLAQVTAQSGRRTILIDMSRPAAPAPSPAAWKPGAGNAGQSIVPDPAGYSRLAIEYARDERFLFSNVDRLRCGLTEDLRDYDAIFVDLPPVPHTSPDYINAAAMASVCDGTLVVGLSGRFSRGEASLCRSELENAQAKVMGIVMNERYNPTLGAELAREARRLRRFAPRISSWLERKALDNAFLN